MFKMFSPLFEATNELQQRFSTAGFDLFAMSSDTEQMPLGALEAMAASDTRLRPADYNNGWHMILRDKEAPLVLADVAAFLNNPAAPLPSGADVGALPRLEAEKKECPPC